MGKRGLILLADDDEMVRETFRGFLEERWETLVAATRTEAITAIGSNIGGLGCVVTDLKMPEVKDGEGVAKIAIEHAIPVIVLTANPEDVSQDIAFKCSAVLNKTNLDPDDLVAAIKRALFEED